jgi:3-methyladenine DNA glycosylase AlkD
MHAAASALRKKASSKQKKINEWFFKTKPGQYGHGDCFLGVTVPDNRKVAKQFKELSLSQIRELLQSAFHEDRLLALFILRIQYESAAKNEDLNGCQKLYRFFLTHRKRINNWDLVDSSAPYIAGHFWYHYEDRQGKGVIQKLAHSSSIWDRRIAIVGTLYLIRQNSLKPSFDLCKTLRNDREDLIHKACGWMLREAGKKNLKSLEQFLNSQGSKLPRTTLRYAIERMPLKKRKHYLESTRARFRN